MESSMSTGNWPNSLKRLAAMLLTAAVALPLTSCNSGPARVGQPAIDAASAGKKALELYDKDGNGVISGAELTQAPALASALARLDTNSDKGVDAEEIAARVNKWKELRTGLVSVKCRVTLDGRPVEGAQVVFEPEPFLGEGIKPAIGVTNPFGDAAPTVAAEDRPAAN